MEIIMRMQKASQHDKIPAYPRLCPHIVMVSIFKMHLSDSPCIRNSKCLLFNHFIFAGAIEIFWLHCFVVFFCCHQLYEMLFSTRWVDSCLCVYTAAVDYKSLLYHYIKSACCCLSFALTRVTSHTHSIGTFSCEAFGTSHIFICLCLYHPHIPIYTLNDM